MLVEGVVDAALLALTVHPLQAPGRVVAPGEACAQGRLGQRQARHDLAEDAHGDEVRREGREAARAPRAGPSHDRGVYPGALDDGD